MSDVGPLPVGVSRILSSKNLSICFTSSFSSIPGFRDNLTTNNPINLILAPLEPHHQGQRIYILITWGTDEVRRGETIFPFQQDSQKFAISHFSEKRGESPTHTRGGSAGGESHGYD